MRRKLPRFLEAVLLSVLCAWGACGCLVSAFSLAVQQEACVLAAIVLWAVLCGLLLTRPWGAAFALLLAALGAVQLWKGGQFGTEMLGVVSTMVGAYSSAYGFRVPQVLQAAQTAADLPMLVWGMGIVYALCRTVCCRKSTLPPMALMLCSLVACLVVTDTVPGERYLFALLLGLGLLMVTGTVRRDSASQATRLSTLAVLPLAASLALLLCMFPRAQFVNTTAQLRSRVWDALARIPAAVQTQGMDFLSGLRPRDRVELTQLPAQPELGIEVAQVTAEHSGSIYLRLRDYDVYTGTCWESTPNRQDTLSGTGAEKGAVTVRLLSDSSLLLIPSYPEGQTFLTGGRAQMHSAEYTVAMREYSLAAYPGEEWLALPEHTGEALRSWIEKQNICTDSVEQTVQGIAEYVKNCADYDRGATTMDSTEGDFALWFLQRGTRGYCVHFATAAVALLRSAGIPARYVTGYRVTVPAGQTVTVTSNDAHAWVEYFNYRTWGWSILEATPATASDLPEMPTAAPAESQPEHPVVQTGEMPTAAAAAPATVPLPAPSAPPVSPEKQLPRWLIPVALAAFVLLGLIQGQRLVRRKLRRRKQSTGEPNRRGLACAGELALLARLLGRPLPGSIVRLTEKAMFSQHTLTQEELTLYDRCLSACRRRLREQRWYKKIVYRYWYAVI